MLELEQAFATPVAARARTWFTLWRLPALGEAVRVRFSARMFRAVGRCYPQRRLVSLAAAVAEMEEAQILAILCHEFAHIAAYEHHGRRIRPHGVEWRALVAAAGFSPSVRFHDEKSIALLRASAPRRSRYLHQCRRCSAERISARRMSHWRCGPCYELGYDGRLQIVQIEL